MEKEKFRLGSFIKRNAAYFVIVLSILAIGLSTVYALLNKNKNSVNNDVTDDTPSVLDEKTDELKEDEHTEKIIMFSMPVANPMSIEEYSDTMVFNSTLKRFSTHRATDFYAVEGTPVLAAYEGVVESVENDLLKGVTVTVDHGNGLKTVYNSLADVDDIAVNSQVSAGDVIGYVSDTNRQESSTGAHLHFEVIENGQSIDPIKYLVIDEK